MYFSKLSVLGLSQTVHSNLIKYKIQLWVQTLGKDIYFPYYL